MKTIRMIAAAAAALAALGMGAAHAQEVTNSRPYSLKLGAFFPVDSDAKDPAGNAIVALDAEYTFSDEVSPTRRTLSKIGVSYMGDNDFSMIPITLSMVFQPVEGTLNGPYYVGGGFGIYITSIDRPYEEGRDKTLLGGFLVAGLNVGESMFAEAKYHIVSRYNDRRVDGIQVSIGGRF